ncbi:hypothetical protein J6TS2_26420 [Heyndrickxia sporothermodurans]|nr:hypothetical protein J6TS2_26420 [Heyndrickxia sporothermodurans]
MNFYLRVLITIIFVGMVIGIALLWGFISSKFEKHYVSLIRTNKGKALIIAGVFLIQLALVAVLSFQFRFFFIDTLFVASFII